MLMMTPSYLIFSSGERRLSGSKRARMKFTWHYTMLHQAPWACKPFIKRWGHRGTNAAWIHKYIAVTRKCIAHTHKDTCMLVHTPKTHALCAAHARVTETYRCTVVVFTWRWSLFSHGSLEFAAPCWNLRNHFSLVSHQQGIKREQKVITFRVEVESFQSTGAITRPLADLRLRAKVW